MVRNIIEHASDGLTSALDTALTTRSLWSDEVGMATRSRERELALAGLREFGEEMRLLRKSLEGYERRVARVVREVERGDPLHEALRRVGVAERRIELMLRLRAFEDVRHRMRVACFRLSLADGLSIGEVSRL